VGAARQDSPLYHVILRLLFGDQNRHGNRRSKIYVLEREGNLDLRQYQSHIVAGTLVSGDFHEVAQVLRSGPVSATFLRAAMILGSGSASFEILRYLVDHGGMRPAA
jgi:hypothetical protein